MMKMLQFSDEMDDISFMKRSSIFDETGISTIVSICDEEGDQMRTLFNQALPLRGRLGLHSSQNTVLTQSRLLQRHEGLHSSQNLDLHANIFRIRQSPKHKWSKEEVPPWNGQ